MAIKFNVEPYYDDFETATAVDGLSPQEKYHRILFRPGHAVQARELTQIQSMLQHQVTSMGNHFFEEGSMVIPGHVSFEGKLDYIKLSSLSGIPQAASYPSTDEGQAQYEAAFEAFFDNQVGNVYTGGTTGITARVVKVLPAEGTDPVTMYVKYLSAGSSGETVFDDGETLTATADSTTYTAVAAASASTGFGSAAFVERGIYYLKGNFVIVQNGSLILDKYDVNPSYDVGLQITESIVDSATDPSLNDNANGTSNYAAPGAHRYQIKSELVKQAVGGTTIENFLLLIRVEEGSIAQKVRTTDYSVIEETLARRTFDESGNYTVRPFMVNVREHTDVNTPGDDAKLALGIEPSKAYVRGYEIETLSTTYVNVDKARDSTLFEAASVPMLIGNYVTIENVEGIPDIQTFERMEIHSSTGGAGGIIGYARARSYVYAGSGEYRIYLFDIQMSSGYTFAEYAKSFKLASTPEFIADIILDGSGKAIIQEPTRNTMVFPLPFNRVKTCDSQPDGVADDFNYVYFCNRYLGSSPVSSGEAVFATVGSNELLEPFDDENWILTVASGANSGDIVPLSTGSVTIATNSESVTISGLGAYEGNNVKLIAGVKRTLNQKAKSLTTSGNDNIHLFSIASPTGDDQLGFADGYKLHAVYMSANMSTPATVNDDDVSEYYDFDNGQRDNFYDLARLKLKPTTAFRPTGQLLVKYEYYTHGGGDFFTIDSYDNLEDSTGHTVSYEDIPAFVSKSTGQSIELRSAIDFRPRVSNAGNNFTGTGAQVSVCPEPLTTFTTDVQYYLNRIDKVYIDKDGNFGVVKGVPAVEPELPDDPKDAMVLYHVFVPAYTLTPEEVVIDMIDNKRYTMRDIGKLEKRINTLEYYTSLSLLEKEAADKQIVDPTTQVQRLKAGFLVDSFASHNVGNVTSPEYRCSIDRANRRLRPSFSEDNVRLLYNSTLSSNVQKTGDLITLPYTETPLFYQSQASGQINVNPFDVFSWGGTVELSPTSDEWKDTTRRPAVVVDQEGVYDAMLGIINETDALGTVWGEWQTNWTGVSISTSTQAFGNGSRRGWGNRIQTTTTTTTTTGQSRQGIETSVVPDTINTNIGDRVVEVNFAPFIRSRLVSFKATRLKPNTEMFAFFDGVAVTPFVRQESTFTKYTDGDNPTVNGKNLLTAHPDGATTLTTNAAGELIGSFFIPNSDALNFKTGTRIFRLCDDPSNNEVNTTTFAEAAYNAKGLIETKENVTISTRVPLIERREVSGNRIISNTRNNTSASWYDPLAQSFMVDLDGGAFITSLDLFFHKKASDIPVTVQIREMNQGLPTQTIVPFGEVTLNPADVNVVDLTSSNPDPNQVTTFTFPSPVYLQQNQEYCFVIMANTNEYEVWYAEIGENNYITGERISKQPYAGVLFKSQNASTWSPDQNKDIKFRMKRADFNIDNPGTVVMNNGSVQERKLIKNPFSTTSGSSLVRVAHRNHHFYEETNSIPSYVTISGATDVNGIPAATMNATHQVQGVEMDSYLIDVGVNATGTGIDGGTDVTVTENQGFNTFYTFLQHLNLPGTNSTWGVRTCTGMSLGATSPTPYVVDSAYTPVIVNQNYTLDAPKVIASDDNEQQGKSFYLRGSLVSTKDNISPVIDLERASVYTISNRINNPVGDNPSTTGPSDAFIDALGNVWPSDNSNPNNAPTGFNYVADFGTEATTDVGSTAAKYVTKAVSLAESADGLRIFLDVNKPSRTYVDLMYKAVNAEEEIATTDWTLATPSEPIPYADDNTYREVEWEIDPPGVFNVFQLKIVLRSSNSSQIPTIKDLRSIALVP